MWLACHNPEIDWKTKEIKIMRSLEECRKQWKLNQSCKSKKEKEKEEERGVRRKVLWNTLVINNFSFLLSIFLDFTLLFVLFFFLIYLK